MTAVINVPAKTDPLIPGDDVDAAHRVCAQFDAPIVNRGGGTGLSGETVNVAVVVDNSKYLTTIGETDVEKARVTVETGAINDRPLPEFGPINL